MTRWLYYLCKIFVVQQWKYRVNFAKIGSNVFYQVTHEPSKNCPRLLKIHLLGEILPNLVTLILKQGLCLCPWIWLSLFRSSRDRLLYHLLLRPLLRPRRLLLHLRLLLALHLLHFPHKRKLSKSSNFDRPNFEWIDARNVWSEKYFGKDPFTHELHLTYGAAADQYDHIEQFLKGLGDQSNT